MPKHSFRRAASRARNRPAQDLFGPHATAWIVLAVSVGLAAWYTTPLSDVVLDLLLASVVPVQADVDLEQEAVRQGSSVASSRYYDAHWTPILRRVGRSLAQTLEDTCHQRNYLDPYEDESDHSNQDNDDLLCCVQHACMWKWNVVDAPTVVNAYCLPAGTIGVTSGLLQTLQMQPTEAQLAALLGHEMGHCIQRHASKRILSQNLVQKLLKSLVYDDNDGYEETYGEALGEILLQSATWLGQQRFSRRDEYQADAVSWTLLQKSSQYTPLALIRLLEQLQALEDVGGQRRRNGNQMQSDPASWATAAWDDWSRTHPHTSDRIETLRQAWKDLPARTRRTYEARQA